MENSTHHRDRPFLSKIKERYLLTKPGSTKETYHVVLDLKDSGIKYAVGDCIGIYPQNDPLLIQQTLKTMKAKGDEVVVDKRSNQEFILASFLETKANLKDLSKKFLTDFTTSYQDLEKKKKLEELLQPQNKEALKELQQSCYLWDFLEEFPDYRLTVQEICHLLMPLLPRLYSIASSQFVVGEEVHLTVTITSYVTRSFPRMGACSHYLCHLAPLQTPCIPIYIQPHHGFTLPEDQNASIIMIGPGTGVAPFRGFMQERIALDDLGKCWLFFGERNREFDYYYEDYWTELQKLDKLQVDLAFSRDQTQKLYVQDLMLERQAQLFDWLEKGAYLYVCGDAAHMAKDVEMTLHRIIQNQSGVDEAKAKEYLKNLRMTKRYLKDVY